MTLERERASLDLRRPTRIGISGSYGGMNLGDEAILQSIIAELRRRIPGSLEVLVFSMGPADTLAPWARHDVERALLVRELSRAEVTEEIGGLDLFILGGGGLLYNGEARHYVRELQIAREFGIPAMTWALGAGPLDDREDRSAVRRVLNRTDAIVVRDERDRRLLQEVGGVGQQRVVVPDLEAGGCGSRLADGEPDQARAGSEPLRPEHVRGERFRLHQEGRVGRHRDVAGDADFLVDRLGATVVFVPMERCRSDLQHARILYAEYTPGQVLGFMSHLELAIGMRLHFLIFPALAGVTFVPLPYASKVEGLVHELGIPSLPIQDLTVGRLLARIDHAWDMRDELRDRVTERLPLLRQRAARTAEMATTLVSSAAVTNP
jgi:polysaccharide pyruvyl transferase WcaK-like protein